MNGLPVAAPGLAACQRAAGPAAPAASPEPAGLPAASVLLPKLRVDPYCRRLSLSIHLQ